MLKSRSSLTEFVYGHVGNDSWLTRFLLPDVKFETISKHHRFYSSQYSKIAEKLSPLIGLSTLSLNKAELERICNDRKQQLQELAENILRVDQEDLLFIIDLAYSSALDKTELQKNESEEQILTSEENFKANLNPYLKTETVSNSEIYSLFTSAEYYFKVAWKLEPLEHIIETVINMEYPLKLEKELNRKEYQSRNTGGRPQDESANQEKIFKIVAELSKKKRFQKADGTLKPTTIRDEILNHHSDVAGNISGRALFDRVKKAIYAISMK